MLVSLEELCKLFSKQGNYFNEASVAEVCVFHWMLKMVAFLPKIIIQVNSFQKESKTYLDYLKAKRKKNSYLICTDLI